VQIFINTLIFHKTRFDGQKKGNFYRELELNYLQIFNNYWFGGKKSLFLAGISWKSRFQLKMHNLWRSIERIDKYFYFIFGFYYTLRGSCITLIFLLFYMNVKTPNSACAVYYLLCFIGSYYHIFHELSYFYKYILGLFCSVLKAAKPNQEELSK